MSKLNVNAVEPSTGTDITLGASGDTITVPSGATIVNSGTATGFGAALTGSTNNTVTTVTAANAISGETNLTFDGTDLTLGTGNIVFGTASKGVYLGVTSATAANLLDDYEENTFTPTVGSLTLDAATGHYTKIGRAVSVQGYVSMGTQSGGTTMIVGGLPFTASSADQYLAVAGNYATDKAQTLRVIGGTSTTALVAQTEHSDNDNSDYNYNDMNGKYFYFHGVYFV